MVIFTASVAEYSDPVIDSLDPTRTIVSKRFFRDSCVESNGIFLKDLSIVEPQLSQVCLIDNASVSFYQQGILSNLENGIPIKSWTNDSYDEALLDLLPFLDALRFCEDVRSILSLRG